MMIEPLGTRVLVKPLDQESTTASGLYLPETAKEKPQEYWFAGGGSSIVSQVHGHGSAVGRLDLSGDGRDRSPGPD